MNQNPATPDLHTLQVFQSVADSGSFTRAASSLGLTQSAVTRQVQQLESTLGTPLFHRTTRTVQLTDAGASLLSISKKLLRDFGEDLIHFRETHLGQPPRIRLGLSHTIAHSHLPGLLAHFQKSHPHVRTHITQDSAARLRTGLLDHELDIAIFTQPLKPPTKLRRLHSFPDAFVIISPNKPTTAPDASPRWFSIDQKTTTGSLLKTWLAELDVKIDPVAELNNFDLIINLVALGLGNAIVPRRAVRLYSNRLPLKIHRPKIPLTRQIGVYRPRSAPENPAIDHFIESILFNWKPSK